MNYRFVLAMLCLALAVAVGQKAFAAEKAELQVGDCLKCHPDWVNTVQESGAGHSSAVNCLDCHMEHPPLGNETIPECSNCHDPDEAAHFALDSCKKCHSPHSPLEIDFFDYGDAKPVCLFCHSTPGENMEAYPSAHAEFDCTFCHSVHRQASECLECHEPHTPDMTYQQCLQCHKPHKPTLVRYTDSTPVTFCASCHSESTNVLKAGGTKHSQLTCAYCHKDQHRMIPECQACHGEPHSSKMLQKFTGCLECHFNPHAPE